MKYILLPYHENYTSLTTWKARIVLRILGLFLYQNQRHKENQAG